MRFSSVNLLIVSVKTISMLTKILIFIPDCPLPHNSSCNVHLADLTQLSGAPAVVVLLNITTLHQSLLGTWQVRIILSYSVSLKKNYFRFVQVRAHHVLLPLCNWDNKIIPPTNQGAPLLLCPKACPSTRHCKIYKIILCSSICFHLHFLLHPQLCHTIQRQSPVCSSSICY